jgi:ATP-dependent Clp protease ATP-binding subunit ClpE
MTSNAGTQLKSSGIGFSNNEKERRDEKLKDALKDYFRPEFLNRVDEIVVFDHLKQEEVREIVDLQLTEFYKEALEKGIQVVVDAAAKDYLAGKGYDYQYGARPLRRQIQRLIEDEIAEMYLRGLVPEEAELVVSFDPQALKLLFAIK